MQQILLVTLIIIVVTVIGLFSMREIGKQKYREAANRGFFVEGEDRVLVAHRGGSGERPENTLEAFRNAVQVYSNVILEMDVHLTKDGQLAVIHDGTLERTTNGTGKVGEHSLAELQALDAGFQFKDETGSYSYREKGVKIPSLNEVLESLPNQRLTVEVKTDSQAAADKTIEVIEKHNAQKRVIIGSQYTKVVDYIKSKRPDWHFCASPQQVFRLVLMSQMFIETFEPMNADGYFIPVEQDGIMVANSRLMSEWNRRKIPVLIWTINDESQARELMKNGANGVITDFPSKMKGVVFNSH